MDTNQNKFTRRTLLRRSSSVTVASILAGAGLVATPRKVQALEDGYTATISWRNNSSTKKDNTLMVRWFDSDKNSLGGEGKGTVAIPGFEDGVPPGGTASWTFTNPNAAYWEDATA